MKLSTNFTLEEFTNSETAKKNSIMEQFNPSQEVVSNLKYGAENIAELIRKEFGSFAPTVAYRCPKLNTILKGSKTSMHVTGEAFDETFIKEGVNISAKVFFWLFKNKAKIPFTELIWEKGDANNPNWLHIGWRKQATQEILVFDGKKYHDYVGTNHYKTHKEKGYV
jgi:hypothetical protein